MGLITTSYSTTASPVNKSNCCVRASAYPLAKRNLPLPPTTGISLTSERTVFRPSTASVLPLKSPETKAKFMAIRSPASSCEARAYIPCAWPRSLEFRSGPSVRGSSIITTAPKPVVERDVVGACATRMAVGLSPLTTSWKKKWRWVSVSSAEAVGRGVVKSSRERRRGSSVAKDMLALDGERSGKGMGVGKKGMTVKISPSPLLVHSYELALIVESNLDRWTRIMCKTCLIDLYVSYPSSDGQIIQANSCIIWNSSLVNSNILRLVVE
ncbi:hypothetical protein IEQ34_008992 [Dendrobium chrysotoxum]|uniref:Uncharacterized protein n=1 Tax=Dendrobium chrysotoxum TaxID=161865 RepID=A0AAV7H0U5_DENCH|nr:hypothetical protein IEQ34_008992 [Dendrobium chrysotoxum]